MNSSKKPPVYLRMTIRSTEDKDKVFFTNEDQSSDPIEINPGSGQIFPKVDELLTTMNVGDRQSIELAKEEAFGEHSQEAIKKVPLENLSEDLQQQGAKVSAQVSNGQTIQGVVMTIEDEFAVIDFNHPLAGQSILVEFKLVENN
jgi:FKBP-type peptidyl-prolyl cis-trans isomerase 2